MNAPIAAIRPPEVKLWDREVLEAAAVYSNNHTRHFAQVGLGRDVLNRVERVCSGNQ
jgi:hypothetical protein